LININTQIVVITLKPEFKFILLGVIIGSVICFIGIQDKTPNVNIIQNFTKKFPTVKEVKWEHISNHEWEADFKMANARYCANFLEDGIWKHTEHEIEKKEIPFKVKSTLETEYHGYAIEVAEISETEEGMVYEFAIKKGESEMEVAIDTSGKIVKKEIIESED